MTIFHESRQEIAFNPSWQVIAIDKHRYYKRLSGHGLKCVDFIAMDNDFGLVLIEVKNYDGKEMPDDLAEIFTRKCDDTIRLIKIINKYLGRQWLYKLIYKKLAWLKLYPKEWKYWDQAEQLINTDQVLKLLEVQK